MKTKLYTASLSRAMKFSLLAFLLFFGAMVNAQYTIYDESLEAPPGFEGGAAANNNDGISVTTSVKFRVSQSGTISSIKFYKGNTATGDHIGVLWGRTPDNLTPVLLGSVLFTGETADGWQIMNFGAPISVSPNIIYTAALWSEDGTYSAAAGWNPSFDTDLTPFIILAGDGNTEPFMNPDFGNGGQGVGNGAYRYTSANPADATLYPQLPLGSGYFSTNFYIDVVFTPTFTLPVSLTDFKAASRDYDVNLAWQTASEQNNMGFEVQRSLNGTDYSPLGFVNGAGESSSKKVYGFTDRNLVPGLYYYRLKQMDNDGRYKFSPVVTATIGRSSNVVLYQSFPNPVRTTAKIQYVLPSNSQVTLSLVDINGRLVRVLDKGARQTGQHSVDLDATRLMSGVYFYKLEVENHPVEVRRVVVQ